MLHSAIDIVALSTGRETLLIGPSSAFGADTRAQLLRDRIRLRHTLDMFMTRPGAVDLLRPHLRRWGLHSAHSALSEKETVKDALLRAAASGRLAIAAIPEVTLAFSKEHAAGNPMASVHLAQRTSSDIFPTAIEERLILVMGMVPGYMTGATKRAFEDALANTGVGVIVGGLMTWLGAHLVPGANVAILAFDLFFLGSDVIRACETIGRTMQQVGDARSRTDLEPAAKVIAGAIAMLMVAGVFKRLMKAKQVTTGPGKEGGLHVVEKPGSGPREPRAVREPRRPSTSEEASLSSTHTKPVAAVPPIKDYSHIKSIEKGKRPLPETYMSKAEIDSHLQKFDNGGSRIMLKKNMDKYGPGQKDGTSFVLPKDEADQLLKSAGGDKRKLEDALGLPIGTLDENELVRVDIPDPKKLNVRVPSGNEAGANDLWLPGGKLPNGNSEAVIDIVNAPPGSFVQTPIKF